MDLVIFGSGITVGTSLGANGWQREAMGLVTFELGITTGTAKGKLKGKLKGKVKGTRRTLLEITLRLGIHFLILTRKQ